jgi:transposase InsO family protein
MRRCRDCYPVRGLDRRRRPGFFRVTRPDELWHMDMTTVWTAAHGWVYLHVTVDWCTREIAGWTVDVRTRADEAIACVEGALLARNVPPQRLVLGTDNGSQFTARDFRKHLSARGVTHRRGGYRDPESQAFFESWFGQFKKRCAWRLQSSETRSPVWIAVMSGAWSRRPSHVSRSGAARSASTSAGEVGRDGVLGSFVGDRENALNQRRVRGFAVGGVAEHGTDRSEARVASPHGVATLVFEVVQEPADQRSVEIGEIELGWLCAGLGVGVGEQQTERVAVGAHGVRAGVQLAVESFGEERLQDRSERGHWSAPSWSALWWSALSGSRRCAASAISSGAADRYQ